MNLSNYFLADLPPEAPLSAAMITEACQTLKRNRTKYLAGRSTQNLVEILSRVAAQWLRPDYSFRKLALENGPATTGFSPATLAKGLDSFFKELTPENFRALLTQELGNPQSLDEMVSAEGELSRENRRAMAHGPELLLHITAGNIPNPALSSIVLGVLVRSAQFIKCARGASLLPRLFAHSLYDADTKLGACLEIAEWPGGTTELEQAVFAESDCVTATGSDESLAAIRRALPDQVRFLGYGHRVSFGYVARGMDMKETAQRVALDVAAWNQLGCLSPHVIYVEGSATVAESFAGVLAEELAAREEIEPRGDIPKEAAATIAARRGIYEVRAAHSPETGFWQSKNSTAWTVIYEADPQFQLSCLHRFIYVKASANLEDALKNAGTIHGQISTVGIAAPEDKTRELATQLARWGVSRVCPLGRMQEPPLTWRHDGRPALGDLVTWTDWER